MAAAIGCLKIAQQLITCGMFHFLTPIMKPPSAKEAQSSGQQMEEVTGLVRPAVPSISCTMCLLSMLTPALSLATPARFSEEQGQGRLRRRRHPQHRVPRLE